MAGTGKDTDARHREDDRSVAQHAALATVANVILNLDEFLTKG